MDGIFDRIVVLDYSEHRLQSPDSTATMRYISTFLVLLIVQLLFTINNLCALVTRSAHKPQLLLYNTILNRDQNIPHRIRLKTMRFVERLSGPKIGFYCYNLFPMTSYYFTDYVLDSIASYFLVLRTLRKSGFIESCKLSKFIINQLGTRHLTCVVF